MYFNKNEVIHSIIQKKPRISYIHYVKVLKITNFLITLMYLSLIAFSVFIFLNEINNHREAYLVKSSGEFSKIHYSQNVTKKILTRFYEGK